MRRLRSLLAAVWLLGCTPATNAPAPTTPGERTRAPDGGSAEEPELGKAAAGGTSKGDEPVEGSDPKATSGGETPKAAPERIDTDINDEYAERPSAKRWEAHFEREGREVFDQRDEILAELGLREGMAVADVGAGSGLFTLALAERVGAKGKVYAVDVQAYFLDHIGQKARKAKLENVALVRAKQDSVGLPEASVDLAIMCDSYHHVEQPAAYLASLKAALRPGGRLVIVDYIAIEGQTEPWRLEHVRATPTEFRAEIESAGFRFVQAHEGVLKKNFFFEFERP